MRWRIDAEVRAAIERERAAAGARERSGSSAIAELTRREAAAAEAARAAAREASAARSALEAKDAEVLNLRSALEGLSHEASVAARLREQLRAAKEAAASAKGEAAASKYAAEAVRKEAEEAKARAAAEADSTNMGGGSGASASELSERLDELETEASTLRRSLAEALRRLGAAEKKARSSVDGAAVRRALASLLGPRSAPGSGGGGGVGALPEALDALCVAAGVDEETKEGYLLNSARGLMLLSSPGGAENGGGVLGGLGGLGGGGGGRKRGALRAAAAAPVALARGAGRLVLGAGGRPVPPARPPPVGAGLTDSWVDYLIAQQEDSPSKVPVAAAATEAVAEAEEVERQASENAT